MNPATDEMMRRAEPWSIEGIKPDIRDAAREAAKRQGLTLSEWLNDIIVAEAEAQGINAADMKSGDRVEAVAARLHQLGGQEEPAGRHTRERIGARQPTGKEAPPRIATRVSLGADRQDELGRVRRLDEWHDNRRAQIRMPDAEAFLDAAVAAFEATAARTQRQTVQSVEAVTRLLKLQERTRDSSLEVLSNISDRLADIETQMTRQAVDAACGQADKSKDLEVLPLVARRLADIESQLSQRPQEDSYNPIKTALARLEARLESFAQKPAASSRDDEAGLKRLESKLDALLQSSSALSPSDDLSRKPAAKSGQKPSWRSSLDSAVVEIGYQQNVLNGEEPNWRSPLRRGAETAAGVRGRRPAETVRPADLHPLQRDIAALGKKIEEMRLQDLSQDLSRVQTEIGTMSAGLADLAPRKSVTALESAIQNLTARIEASREDGMRETLLKPITELADDLRHSLDRIPPQASIEALEREIRTIGGKLEALAKRPHEPEALARIQEQTREIHHLLTSASIHPLPLEQIEKKIASLAEQIDRQHALGPLPYDLEFAGSQIQQPPADSLGKIEDRLDVLTQKVEKAIAARPVTAQMDHESLEAVVRVLADKFTAAQDPKAGHAAFAALQNQIAELAQRLEQTDSGFSALSSLQHSVGELFTHLDETRAAAAEVAQSSAREAAREAVREVLEQPQLTAGHFPDEAVITREIADLRVVQDEADRRTHSTLNAVHETLEKIVDRLAMLEEEIGEQQEATATQIRLSEQNALLDRYRDVSSSAGLSGSSAPRVPEAGRRAHDVPPIDPALRVRQGGNNAADFLIEPGTLFPMANEASSGKDKRPQSSDKPAAAQNEPARSRSDFIAAARRAALAAQASQGQTDASRPRIPMGELKSDGTNANLIAQARDFIINHRRQLTLSVAALFLAVGAYAVVKTMGHTSVDVSSNPPKAAMHSMADQPERKTSSRAAANDGVAELPRQASRDQLAGASYDAGRGVNAPATSALSAPPSNLPLMAAAGNGAPPQKSIAGSDPIVTGSIIASKMGASAPAETPAAALALREQADAGNAAAQYELATRYAEGRLMPRDFKLASDWYEKAAMRGLAPAQYRLGSLYEKGIGVTRDLLRAKSWYEKAAMQGHSHAMHNLAVLIAEGADGKPDYANAATWFRKAAEFGIRDSQYNLAILFARGLGVPQDLVQSYTWFSIAAAQGDEDAGRKRDDVAAKLDAKLLGQAKADADAFQPRVPDRAVNEVQIPAGGWEASVPVQVTPKSAKAKISSL